MREVFFFFFCFSFVTKNLISDNWRVMYGGSSHWFSGHFKFQAGLSAGQLKGLSRLVSKLAGSFISWARKSRLSIGFSTWPALGLVSAAANTHNPQAIERNRLVQRFNLVQPPFSGRRLEKIGERRPSHGPDLIGRNWFDSRRRPAFVLSTEEFPISLQIRLSFTTKSDGYHEKSNDLCHECCHLSCSSHL